MDGLKRFIHKSFVPDVNHSADYNKQKCDLYIIEVTSKAFHAHLKTQASLCQVEVGFYKVLIKAGLIQRLFDKYEKGVNLFEDTQNQNSLVPAKHANLGH